MVHNSASRRCATRRRWAGWLQLGAGNLNLRKIARGNSNTFCIPSSISLAVIITASNIESNHVFSIISPHFEFVG